MNAKIRLFKGKTHSDGTHPVQLQYYVDGRTKRQTVARCKPEDWDERACRLKSRARNATIINHRLTEAITVAERLVYSILAGESDISAIFRETQVETLSLAIDMEIARFEKAVNPTMVRRVNSYRNTLSLYCRLESTSLSQMNLKWIEGLANHLKGKGNKPPTISKALSFVKRVLREYYKVPPDIEKFQLQGSSRPVKQKLTVEEFRAIEDLDLAKLPHLQVPRDIFVLQVFLRGIRIGDILQAKCSDFNEGRFFYTADKTGKRYSINVVPAAESIIDRYKGHGDYLFPLFTWSKNSRLSEFDNEKHRLNCKAGCTTIVNKALKEVAKEAGINKPLSSHIARHTFARMAIDKIHNPMVTMDLLGHSSLKVHQQYLNDIRRDDVLDDAANSIFG